MSKNEVKTGIISTIKKGITHYRKIALEINKTEGNIRKNLSIMKKDGQVIPIGGGHYQLPLTPVPVVDNLTPGRERILRADDYIESNEKALRLLVKTREAVNKLMNSYENGTVDFPAQEIISLEKLERTYKEPLQAKTKKSEEIKEREFNNFVIIPDNHRVPLTYEQYEARVMYKLFQLKKIDEVSGNNVIIEENDDQICFPFYPL